MRKHFHVLSGLRGLYMPNENTVHRTRKSAEATARETAANARDDGYKVRGSASSGLYAVGEDQSIEITACDVADCLDDVE